MKTLAKIISTFFGIGYAPVAPGTAASLCLVLGYRFYLHKLSWPMFLLYVFVVFAIGVLASTATSRAAKLKDPGFIVIDEVAGQSLALFLLEPTWGQLAAAFLLFRLFDILKPFPIRKTETFPEGWGIMLDDVLAGLYAGIVLNIFLLIS